MLSLLWGKNSLKEYKIPAGVSKTSDLNAYIYIENGLNMAFQKQKGREFSIMLDVYKMNEKILYLQSPQAFLRVLLIFFR